MNQRDKVRKLLRIAKSTPNTPEGKNALRHAKLLIVKHGWTEAEFRQPKEMSKPVPRDSCRHSQDTAVSSIVDSLFDLFQKR